MNKKQKGITLIALIITIIVMLILVSVTINVALNGGLFEKAKTAGTRTQREADRETLLFAVVGSYDNTGKVSKSEFQANISNINFSLSGNDFPYMCTSPSNNVFYVYENGEITDELKTVTSTKVNDISDIDEDKLYNVTFKAIDSTTLNSFTIEDGTMKTMALFDTNNNPVGALNIVNVQGTKGAVVGDGTRQYRLANGIWEIEFGEGTSQNEISFLHVKILTDDAVYAQEMGTATFVTQEILDSGIVEIEESENNNPSVNEYGFYENTVYVSNDNTDYLCFTGNTIKSKTPFGVNEENYNISSQNPQYTLKNNETVDITGYVIENEGKPFYLIKNNGNILMLTVSFGGNNDIESLEVIESNELLYTPNFNLNPDDIFTE